MGPRVVDWLYEDRNQQPFNQTPDLRLERVFSC
jgi:hypothetical protein